MRLAFRTRTAVSLFAAGVLGACAGGGGGSGPAPTLPAPPSSPPPSSSLPPLSPATSGYPSAASPEYTRGWAIADTRAIAAWEDGHSGEGVMVAVIDDGVDAFHPELSGRIHPNSKDILASRNQLFDPDFTHGSELSAIIAGKYNSSATVGLAFNATVLAIRSDNGSGTFSSTDLAAALDYARAQGAQVVNFSLGGDSPATGTFLAAMEQATDAGMIVVVSSGNEGNPDPNYPGQLATDPNVSNGLIVNVGAHDGNGDITSFSNRAGNARDFYLTAPGLEIYVPDFGATGPTDPAFQTCYGDATCEVQGTSYSAPYAAGAVALLLGAFPGLTPAQVVDLLYSSTDDAGAPGVDAVYGHGRLNLAAAFAPASVVAAPIVPNAAEVPMAMPLGVAGAAFGDGLVAAPGVWRTVGFDHYDRAFPVDLSANWSVAGTPPNAAAPLLWATAAAGPAARVAIAPHSAQVHDPRRALLGEDADIPVSFRMETHLGRGLSFTASQGVSALDETTPAGLGGHFADAGVEFGTSLTQSLDSGLALTAAVQTGEVTLADGFGTARRTAAALRLSGGQGRFAGALTSGSLLDEGSVLGLAWSGSLAAPASAETGFVHVAGTWSLSETVSLGFEAETGRTQADGGWLRFEGSLLTSAFALGARLDWTPAPLESLVPGAKGRLVVRALQPTRVESGAAAVTLPTATAWGRPSLGYETRRFAPVPSGREIRLSAAYEIWDGGSFSARAGLSLASQPGHVDEADPEAAAELAMRVRF